MVNLALGKETRPGLAERLALGKPASAAPLTVWLHGASLGELTSSRNFMQHLLSQHPGLRIVVTCNTYTARDMVQNWGETRLCPRLAPLDSPAILGRFLALWQPKIAFTLENEIWPARIVACATANIPFVVISGRMSAKTYAMWARFPKFARHIMGQISALAPLDAQSAEHFRALGIADQRIGTRINLKSGVQLPTPDASELEYFCKIFDRKNTILAASTHSGEEEIILVAYKAALAKNPQLRLILAPRHPDRRDRVAQLISAAGFGYNRRSDGRVSDINLSVYLADTIGEMPLWYTVCILSIVGASFVEKRGHTPFEPVQFGSVVVHGPSITNHSEAYKALSKAKAAYRATADTLGQVISDILQGGAAEETAHRASVALAALRPDSPENLLAQLDKMTDGKLTNALLSWENQTKTGN